MRGPEWTLADEIKLAVMWMGFAHIQKISDELGRSVPACYGRCNKLNLPKRVNLGRLPPLRNRKPTDNDWKMYYLHSKLHLNKKEISEWLNLNFGHVRYRIDILGLALHPPAGEPPEWYKELVSGNKVFSKVFFEKAMIEV